MRPKLSSLKSKIRNKKRQFLSLSVKNAETASNEIMKRMVRSWRLCFR